MSKIGNTTLRDKPLFLAPMEDVSDASFRKICKSYGADYLYTEFISSDALLKDIKRTKLKMQIYEDERPVGIQIYGNIVSNMISAAKIAEEFNPDVIDINFGCPVKKIANRGGGSGMLRDIPKMLEITSEIVKAVNLPVTVKTRIGWDDKSIVIPDLAEQLQDCGIHALTIHGRTRAQMYTGEADWETIGKVKNNSRIKIPIIGNGDMDSPEKVAQMFDRYGVDGIMIGRGSIGNPAIFKHVRHFLDTGKKLPALSLTEQVEHLRVLVNSSIEAKGLPGGLLHMRRHMAKNFADLENFRDLRIKMLRCNEPDELNKIFDQIIEVFG